MDDRVHTPDGPGVVQEVERRQGRTWISVAGRGFNGWYLSHEVTADIGDHNTVNLDDLPDRDDGAMLPYDPDPRDTFHNQLNIQPTADLPENLDDTPSIRGLRNYDPTKVFGASEAWDDYAPYDDDDDSSDSHTDTLSQPGLIGDNSDIREKAGDAPEGNSHESAYNIFGRIAHARHMHGGTTDVEDLPDETDQIPGDSKDPYKQVPSSWKSKQPGLDDYGEHYDEINDYQRGDDGPFKTGGAWQNIKDLVGNPDSAEEHPDDPGYTPLGPESQAFMDQYHQDHPDGNPRTKKHQAAGPEFDGDPGTFERTQDTVASPHEDNPFEDWAVEQHPDDPRESSVQEYHVASTGDGFLVTSETGAPMSRYYSTEDEAVHHARFAAYEDFLDRDPMARQAAWADVRKKALRLRNEGAVHVAYYEPKEIQAEVQGDNGLYDTSVSRKNAFGNGVTYYNCSCPWGQWAFKRQYTYVGRFCSHGLAAYHEMQSMDNKGIRSFNEDQNPFLNPQGSTDLGTFTQHIGSAEDDGEYSASPDEWSSEYRAMVETGHPGGDWYVQGSSKEQEELEREESVVEGDFEKESFYHYANPGDGQFTGPDMDPDMRSFFSWVQDNATPPSSRGGGMGRPEGPGHIPAPGDIDYPGLIKQYCASHGADENHLMQVVGDYFDEAPYMMAMGSLDWQRFADVSMLNDSNGDFADGSDMPVQKAIPAQVGPLEPVGMDPSHTMDPADGEMQVFSDPAMGLGQAQQQPMTNNDNDAYGRGQDMNQGGGGVAQGVLDALTGGGDPLDGQEVPHQPDGDVAMMGIEVAHDPSAGMGDSDGDGYANPGGPEQQQGIDPSAMMGGAPSMGNPGDADIAQMAQQFLAKTSAKNYSLREQEELMHEKGSARQFGDLNTANSLYEEPRSFLDM